MIYVNRREAMRMVAASVAAVMTCGVAVASDPAAIGNGACTKCNCLYYQSSPNKICSNPNCKHSYDAHKRIHPPQADDECSTAAETFCVAYTQYKKVKGVVTKISSGKVGPYTTRLEAQSQVDQYNADDRTEKGVRYFYEAKVVSCKP